MMENTKPNLPHDFVDRLPRIVPADQLNAVLLSFARRPTTFRVNTLKTTREELLSKLVAAGFQIDSVPWYSDAFIMRNQSKAELIATSMYANGELYVQSLSSMIPPLVLAPQPGESVCDLTAAPGSKTTQMAAQMRNTGEIIANDRSKIRLHKLVANLKLQGVTNARTRLMNGEEMWKKFPAHFDKVLVDAPCSLEGRFEAGNPKSFGDWSLRKVDFLSKIQSHLLRSAVTMTKPGGVIVYSTCTLSPEENEGVINWLLEKEPGAVEIVSIDFPLPNAQPGLTEWQGKRFADEIENTVRIVPNEIMEGFYLAKLKKIKD